MRTGDRPHIAIGSRLKGVEGVRTLGLKPNFDDYTREERRLIREASIILYPTQNYAEFFSTMGKRIFPSLETHLYADEKIKQTTLFNLFDLPHPRTRFYYHLHHPLIAHDFEYPFIGKIPRRSARGRGVFFIADSAALDAYLARTSIAYIQEYLPHTRDLRVVLINYEPVLAYWRVKGSGNFRANLAQGGTIVFDDVPEEAVRIARDAAIKCRFDDVGLDLIHYEGTWHVIEANMKYGRKALQLKGIDPLRIIRRLLDQDRLGRQAAFSCIF
ncbi:RimK-like ATP-grasp domain protein [uncultured Desulfatiglans sp.]|nr:RimK-like ATP-grasp domain protein [uncultured Desulfatiglans sp.]